LNVVDVRLQSFDRVFPTRKGIQYHGRYDKRRETYLS
jgi:hypothetical protein